MAPLAFYVEEVLTIVKQPGWVTEGIFLLWTDPLLHQADYIVLCDIPWLIGVRRIVYRHISKSLQGINPYPSIKSLFKLLKDTRYLYKRSDTPPTEFIREYLEKYRKVTEPSVAGFTEEFAHTYLEKYREITEPPTEEFAQMYQETYKDDAEAPAIAFLRMYHKRFIDTFILNQTLDFTRKYIEKYKEKVFVVRNNVDRERLIEFLTNVDQKKLD